MVTQKTLIERIARESLPVQGAGAPHPKTVGDSGMRQVRAAITALASKVNRLSVHLGTKIISGLRVYATDPPSSRVFVDPGTGMANGDMVVNPARRVIDIPLSELGEGHVWHLTLLPDGALKLLDGAPDTGLLVAKIVAPTDEAARVIDEAPNWAGADPDAYIIRGNDLVLATGYVFDEDTRAEFLQSLDHVETDFLFGDIDLDEGRSISTADGSVTINSAGISTQYESGRECFRVDTQGLVLFNPDGEIVLAIRDEELQTGSQYARKPSDETITGLWTFSRGTGAPFAVLDGSATVTYFDADTLDGYHGVELGALAENELVTGDWTFRDTLDVISVGANVNATLTVDSQGGSSRGEIIIRGAGEAGSSHYSALQLWSNEATPLAWSFAHEDITGDNNLVLGDWDGAVWNSAVFIFANTGKFTASSIQLGGATVGSSEWAHLVGQDQSVITSDKVQFFRLGLNTATVPHAGIGAAATRLALDSGAIQFTHTNDNWPTMQINAEHDNGYVSFDAYFNDLDPPNSWRSSDAGSNFIIYKFTDQLQFRTDSGVAAGSDLTWDTIAYFDVNGDFWHTGTNKSIYGASTESVGSSAAGYLDLRAATTVRAYGADDDTNDFEVYSGSNMMAAFRRASAGNPTITRLVVPNTLHIYSNTSTLNMAFANADTRSYRPMIALSSIKFQDNITCGFGNGAAAGTATSFDARIRYNGTNLFIDPDNIGSGKVYIGETADDDIVASKFMVNTDAAKHMQWDGTDFLFTTNAGEFKFTGGSIELDAAEAVYLGDAGTNGTWQIIRSGDDLIFARRESGSYVTKMTIED
jgi:hypothetical protein